MVQKKHEFLKTAQPTGFLCFIGFGFWDFLFEQAVGKLVGNKQLGSLLVDLGHQLSFYLGLPVL